MCAILMCIFIFIKDYRKVRVQHWCRVRLSATNRFDVPRRFSRNRRVRRSVCRLTRSRHISRCHGNLSNRLPLAILVAAPLSRYAFRSSSISNPRFNRNSFRASNFSNTMLRTSVFETSFLSRGFPFYFSTFLCVCLTAVFRTHSLFYRLPQSRFRVIIYTRIAYSVLPALSLVSFSNLRSTV